MAIPCGAVLVERSDVLAPWLAAWVTLGGFGSDASVWRGLFWHGRVEDPAGPFRSIFGEGLVDAAASFGVGFGGCPESNTGLKLRDVALRDLFEDSSLFLLVPGQSGTKVVDTASLFLDLAFRTTAANRTQLLEFLECFGEPVNVLLVLGSFGSEPLQGALVSAVVSFDSVEVDAGHVDAVSDVVPLDHQTSQLLGAEEFNRRWSRFSSLGCLG